MHVSRPQAIRLLEAVGFEDPSDFDDAKIVKNLRMFPIWEERKKMDNPENDELKNLKDDVIAAVEAGEGIVLLAPAKDGRVALATEDSDEDSDSDSDEGDEAELEGDDEEPELAGPTKTKSSASGGGNGHHPSTAGGKTPKREQHGFRQVTKPMIKAVTPAMAERHLKLQAFPRDRGLQKSRKDHHKQVIESGDFIGNTWDSVRVIETGEVYRVNGRHTAQAFWELFSDGFKNPRDLSITSRTWEAETMEDAVRLYGTFDPKWSARTKGNLIQSHAGASTKLLKIKNRIVALSASGLGFALHEKDYKKRTVEEQGSLLLEHVDFVVWLGGMLAETKKCPHLLRMPVVAAMVRTFLKHPDQSTEFWTDVRDEPEDNKSVPKTNPVRVLRNWLLMHNFGAKSGEKAVAVDREGYLNCLEAWNCFRKNEVWKPSKYKPESETPVIK